MKMKRMCIAATLILTMTVVGSSQAFALTTNEKIRGTVAAQQHTGIGSGGASLPGPSWTYSYRTNTNPYFVNTIKTWYNRIFG